MARRALIQRKRESLLRQQDLIENEIDEEMPDGLKPPVITFSYYQKQIKTIIFENYITVIHFELPLHSKQIGIT